MTQAEKAGVERKLLAGLYPAFNSYLVRIEKKSPDAGEIVEEFRHAWSRLIEA